MQAIILAGGFGTRLRSALADVPKPMAPIGAKPFLAYLLDYLLTQGVTQVVLSVHYLREQIQSYFQSEYRGITIRYAIEEEPLGTGGAMVNSFRELAQLPTFVLNGDTFLKLDYREMYLAHEASQQVMAMALRKVPDCSRYGIVEVEQGSVVAFKDQGGSFPGLINAGVYLINPALLTMLQDVPEPFSFERDFLFPNIAKIQPQAFVVEDYFIDIGIPEDYSRAKQELPELLS